MYAQIDKERKVIDFFSDGNWIEGMSYEDTALFIADVTKLLSEVKK